MRYRLTSEPLIFLYTTIFTINYTILPQLVLQKICLQNYNESICESDQFISADFTIKRDATRWWFYLLCGSLVPSVFTVLIWGSITDVIGRKRAMFLVPILNAIRALIYLINSYYINVNVAYMLFGSFISCIYGEFQGVVALCYAYMADVTTGHAEHRTMRMALVEASLFFAGIPAGLLSGFLLQKIGFVAVFGLNIGINFFMLLYVALCLPNELKTEYKVIRSAADDDNDLKPNDLVGTSCTELFNPFFQLRRVFSVITGQESRVVVIPLLLSFGCSVCAVYGELVVETLYLKSQPFVFSANTMGYYAAFQSAVRGLGVIIVTHLSFHLYKWCDYTLIFIGILSQIVCYVLIGVARSTLAVFVVNISGFAIPVATTTLRSLTTKQVSPNHYGAVLGALEATDAIAGVLANALTLWMFDLSLHVYSGVVYFSLSAFALFAGLFVFYPFWKDKRQNIQKLQSF